MHIVKTPDSDSDGAKPKKGGLDSVDDGWVTTHARQVRRLRESQREGFLPHDIQIVLCILEY